MKTYQIVAVCAMTVTAAAAWAEHTGEKPCVHDMHVKPMPAAHAMHTMAPSGFAMDNPAVRGLEQANATMHRDMAIDYTGDADVDFLAGMIPHHQGAVDMADVVLRYGRDPQVRRLAMEIIRAQNLEIRWMRRYVAQLKARGVTPVPAHAQPKAGYHDSNWTGKSWLNER